MKDTNTTQIYVPVPKTEFCNTEEPKVSDDNFPIF